MDSAGKIKPDTLFLFIDESGNFDFSDRGTRHFVMAGIATLFPVNSSASLQTLKYRLLAGGFDVASFHASEDRQIIRDRVFELLRSQGLIVAHAVFGDKSLAPPDLRSDSSLLAHFGERLISTLIAQFPTMDYQQVVLLFDQSLPRKKRDVFYATVKPQLKALKKPFHIFFHSMQSDLNGQFADYVSWARYVALERNELRPWHSFSKEIGALSTDMFAI